MDVHLNEFLRRLVAEGVNTAPLLHSLVFKREVEDGMNIGEGTWRLSMLKGSSARFLREDRPGHASWDISRAAGSLDIIGTEEIVVRRTLMNSKNLVIKLGKRHCRERDDPW